MDVGRSVESALLAAELRAAADLLDAHEAMRAADADLARLAGAGRPSWGGVVDAWHDAAGRVAAAREAVEAFRVLRG